MHRSEHEQASPQIDLERVGTCPACGSSLIQPFYSGLIDWEEGVPGSWCMSRCGDCQTLLLDPRPTAEYLSRVYGTYYTHSAPNTENQILDAEGFLAKAVRCYLRKKFGLEAGPASSGFTWMIRLTWPLRQQLDYFMRHLPRQKGRILDIGCGSGGFLQRASKSGWYAVGVEPDPAAASVARKYANGRVYGSTEEVEERDFDMVTLAHVIEHVYEPSAMLAQCFRILKPGGRIWLATPNVRSLGHRLYRDAWQPLETPRHLVMPNAATLGAMMSKAGFAEVRVLRRGRGSSKRLRASADRARRMERSGGLPSLLSIAVDGAASLFPRAAEELVMVGTKPPQ